jgi:LuxR family transcriptional regulator, maltose regulon positive regulatory protein
MASIATAQLVRRRPTSNTTVAGAGIRVDPLEPVAASRAGLVSRGGLVRRLAGAPDARLVVIVAPPGYGKSTLLYEWAAKDSRRFLWLALTARGGDHGKSSVTRESLHTAIRSLRGGERSFVVVLDNAHRLSPKVLCEVVDALMEQLPEGSTVALASRTEPALPLGRMRANRLLVEVRLEDLAMTSGEASILLRRAGLELSIGEVETLVQRTEGWPAALYLGALAVREQVDAVSAVAQLRGDDHDLAEYFRDEVLSELSDELMEFAIRTSVLDELSGALCDAVLDRRGSGIILSELERACPLLQPVDPAHERLRWHGLIRDGLRAELRRVEPELARTLHLRASSWHAARGDTDRAIGHAVQASDCALTGDLLWGSIVEYVTQARNELVQDWVASFTRDELAGHPRLALAAAYSFLAAGDAAQARHYAVAAAAAMEREADRPGNGSLAAGLAGIEGMIAPAGIPGMADAAARACELEPLDSPWRPIYLFLHGAALHLGGEPLAGAHLLEEAADLSAATAPSLTSMCLAQAAMIAIEQRDWEAATDLADRARNVIDARGLGDYPVSALAFAASAAARAHDGRADEAKQDLCRGSDLLAALGDFIPWYGAEARILLAHASLWLADVVGARTLLAEASRLARRTHGAMIFQQWFDDAWSRIDGLAETSLAGPSSLTIAELRILRFLPSHRSFREIAAQLGVSANTVKTQAHAVYRKLGAASRSEAVERALDAGLLGQ